MKMAQFYVGRKSQMMDVYGMKTKDCFPDTLEDNIRKQGAMSLLISDSDRVEIGQRVKILTRVLHIPCWQSEPYQQGQNYAEHAYMEVKISVTVIMNASGAEDGEWLLVLQYVVFTRNRMALKSLGWRTPIEAATGVTPDISAMLQMPYRTEVYFLKVEADYPSDSTEELGWFVGFSENVGHDYTFKVLTKETRKVLHRSRLRIAHKLPNKRLPELGPQQEHPKGELAEKQLLEDSEVLKDRNIRWGNGGHLKGTPLSTLTLEDLKGRSYLRPIEADGSRARAEILDAHAVEMDKLRGEPERICLRYKIGEEEEEELIAYNHFLEFVESEFETDNGEFEFKKILQHHGPLAPNDPDYKGSNYNVLLLWEDGTRTWIPLKNIRNTAPVVCVLYGQEHGLLEEPGWVSFKPYVRREKRMI
jgi:hypothetical protein